MIVTAESAAIDIPNRDISVRTNVIPTARALSDLVPGLRSQKIKESAKSIRNQRKTCPEEDCVVVEIESKSRENRLQDGQGIVGDTIGRTNA